MSLHRPLGHVRTDSDNAALWREVLGELDVPLKSPVPVHLRSEEDGSVDEFYYVDLDRLTPEQVERLALEMSKRFNVPLDEVKAGFVGEHGLPIRSSTIAGVSFDARMLL